jgi:MerC mercury resistance protein
MKVKLNWDAMGVATSIVCAIHCALLPLFITSLPFLGIDIINNVFFEWFMIGIAFTVGIYSLAHGYIKHHQSIAPIVIFSIGFIFLVLKQFFPLAEIALLMVAVIFIVVAHFYNYKLCKKSKCTSPHHTH